MIRMRGWVEYDGGRVENIECGRGPFIAWEAYCRRQGITPYDQSNPNTMLVYIAYTVLGIEEGFDVWRKSVVDWDFTEAETVPPTSPVPSLGVSSSSPS
jgi:hypothetical protein